MLPAHSHKNDCLFRVVISGSIMFKEVELVPGDWMYVPTGMEYSFVAGKTGCLLLHLYNGSGLYPALRATPGVQGGGGEVPTPV